MNILVIISFFIGCFIGPIILNLFNYFNKISFNKITIMRRKINNKDYVFTQYKYYLNMDKENDHYYTFECKSFFVGTKQAEINKIFYKNKVLKTKRRQKFLESRIMILDTNYYLKFIGEIEESELKKLRRNTKLSKLIK